MVDKLLSAHYSLAKTEGRLCDFEVNGVRCNWMITKANWKKGHRVCAGHYSALKGVNPKGGYGRYFDEAADLTGDAW